MTPRERIDFSILTLFFGALAGAALSAGVMSAEWFVCGILSYILVIYATEFTHSNLPDIQP